MLLLDRAGQYLEPRLGAPSAAYAGAIQGRGAGHHADLCVAVALAMWVQGLVASAR
jgi:hypothetical protein